MSTTKRNIVAKVDPHDQDLVDDDLPTMDEVHAQAKKIVDGVEIPEFGSGCYMRVKMNVNGSSADGHYAAGTIQEIPAEWAADWVNNRWADWADDQRTAVAEPKLTATSKNRKLGRVFHEND